MTMDEHTTSFDHGTADSLGSGSAAPRRRPRAPRPLNDARVRKLVAGILQNHVAELTQGGTLSDEFIAAQLDDVINELLDVE